MEQIKIAFSEKIRAIRTEHGLTQEQASEYVFTCPRCFQKWEEGSAFPDFIHLLFLVYYLDFDVEGFAKEVFSGGYISYPQR